MKNIIYLVNSKEFKYLTYIIDELNKLEQLYIKLMSDRDVKLTFVLDTYTHTCYTSALESIDNLKTQINDLDIYNLVPKDLDEIAVLINDLGIYFDYYKSKLGI